MRALGAEQVIDYRAERFESLINNLDVVFDTVGGETLERSWTVLKPNGRLVTVATGSAVSTVPRVREAFFIVHPDQAQLRGLARLLDAGLLRPQVGAVFSLAQARAAYLRAHQGHIRGKLVLQVTEAAAEGLQGPG